MSKRIMGMDERRALLGICKKYSKGEPETKIGRVKYWHSDWQDYFSSRYAHEFILAVHQLSESYDDEEIAGFLNMRGMMPPMADRFTAEMVKYMREVVYQKIGRLDRIRSKFPSMLSSAIKDQIGKSQGNYQVNGLELFAMAQDFSNWKPMTEIPNHYGQFTEQALKSLFCKRAEHPGLDRCSSIVGKRLFINVPLFGLWLAGKLPEQRAAQEKR